MASTGKAKKPQYRVLVGINYGDDDKRAEADTLVDDLPEGVIHKLVSAGVIEPVEDN